MSKGRNQIIQSAIELFSSNAYENVAISQICKNAKVSNGLFYKHFKNKEEVFKFLLKETSIRIDNYFKKLTGDSVEERLKNFIEINFLLTKKEWPLIQVYREGQYKFVEYEKILRGVYLNALENIFERNITEYEYLYIMSGIRYINVNFVSRGIANNLEFLTEILLNGVFKEESVKTNEFKNLDLYLRVLFNSSNFKNKILIEGEKQFGNKGIYDTKISDIATAVGGGVGSFYYHYKNKEDFLKEIGFKIKNTLMFFLKDNSESYKEFSIADKYLLYIYLMLEYYQKSSYKYQIMRELEFIDPQIYNEFYQELEKFYISALEETDYTYREKQIVSNVFLGIAHYMGIEFFFMKTLSNKDQFLKKMGKFMINGVDYK